jgi:prepilin-type N-terminal cleavage/methylation domain-containing protein
VPVTALLRRARARLREERGFALTEMLVASLIGTILLLVVFDLVDASQEASSRVEARVDGTQRGRVAVEQVMQRLRSQTCVQLDDGNGSWSQEPPIVSGDNDSVSFYSDLGDGSDYLPEVRRISVVGNDLVEQVSEGVEATNGWRFPSPTSEHIVLDGVRPVKDSGGNALPYFRYYAYDAGTLAQPTVLLNTPLSDADTDRVVKVELAFKAQPAGARDEMSDTNFVNSVITRFANPTSADTAKRGPLCE